MGRAGSNLFSCILRIIYHVTRLQNSHVTADGNIYMELITRYWRVHFNYVGYAHARARARFAYYANNLRNSLTNLFCARNASVNFHYLLFPFEGLDFNAVQRLAY